MPGGLFCLWQPNRTLGVFRMGDWMTSNPKQAAWRLRRHATGKIISRCAMPTGEFYDQTWTDIGRFLTGVDEWVEEMATKAPPGVKVIAQDWAAAHPAWPWPSEISDEHEWLVFLQAMLSVRHGYNIPAERLADLAKNRKLLRRFLRDPGSIGGGPAGRIMGALSEFKSEWNNMLVTCSDTGCTVGHVLESADGSWSYSKLMAVVRYGGDPRVPWFVRRAEPDEFDDHAWARADAALAIMERLGNSIVPKLSEDTRYSQLCIKQMANAARLFPPATRDGSFPFTLHKLTAKPSNLAGSEMVPETTEASAVSSEVRPILGSETSESSSDLPQDPKWVLADHALEMTRRFGRSAAAKMAKETGLSPAYIRMLAKTAETFLPSKRDPAVSFSQHRCVLTHDQPIEALRQASATRASCRDILSGDLVDKKKDRTRVTVKINDDELVRVDHCAQRFRITRSAYIRMCLYFEGRMGRTFEGQARADLTEQTLFTPVTLRMNRDEFVAVKDKARQRNLSMSAYVRTCLRRFSTGATNVNPSTAFSTTTIRDDHTPFVGAYEHVAALETLTAEQPLSRYLHVLQPLVGAINQDPAAWFRKWPLSTEVLDRIEAALPLIS